MLLAEHHRAAVSTFERDKQRASNAFDLPDHEVGLAGVPRFDGFHPGKRFNVDDAHAACLWDHVVNDGIDARIDLIFKTGKLSPNFIGGV